MKAAGNINGSRNPAAFVAYRIREPLSMEAHMPPDVRRSPSFDEALHAAHIIRDFGFNLSQSTPNGPIKDTAKGAAFQSCRLVSLLPFTGESCPICGLVFRIGAV